MYVSRQSWAVRRTAEAGSLWPGADAMTHMSGETSHAALIRVVAISRDRAAFAVLFSHYAPRIKSFLQRRGADAATAEELAQEALLAVWRKAAQFDPGRATAGAWIFAIARNLHIDWQRRARRAVPAPDPTDDPPPDASADDVLAADQRARRLHDAIAALPAEQSEALRLAYFDERSHSEVETALAIPLGTVKSRLRLAMARLRAALEEDT